MRGTAATPCLCSPGLAKKWYGHEESIRVPLVIYDPRDERKVKGIACDKIALNIDVAPTILDPAGATVPEGMQGVDPVKLAAGGDPSLGRRDFFYEHTFMRSPGIPQVEGVVSLDFKYMKFIEHSFTT